MRLIASLAALAALSACTDWSMDDPTDEQRAIAAYVCRGDDAALSAYLAARGDTIADLDLPDLGPERNLYCALRGNRIAGP